MKQEQDVTLEGTKCGEVEFTTPPHRWVKHTGLCCMDFRLEAQNGPSKCINGHLILHGSTSDHTSLPDPDSYL